MRLSGSHGHERRCHVVEARRRPDGTCGDVGDAGGTQLPLTVEVEVERELERPDVEEDAHRDEDGDRTQ